MTGAEWDRMTASYQRETKFHWRLCGDNIVKEAKRLEKRKRSEEPWFLKKKNSAPQQLEQGILRCPRCARAQRSALTLTHCLIGRVAYVHVQVPRRCRRPNDPTARTRAHLAQGVVLARQLQEDPFT